MIRQATRDDVPAISGLVRDLAEYERALDQVEATAEQLEAALFGEQPAVFAHVAEHDGQVVGFALWFLNFSTWRGCHGIYLEDLYVRPDVAGPRVRQGAAGRAGGNLRRPRVRQVGVVGAGLERARRSVSTARSERSRWTSGRCIG